MKKLSFLILSLVLITSCTKSEKKEAMKKEEPKASVYFVNLKDGDVVTSPLLVKMGIRGMALEPAGAPKPNVGHHHIIVDGEPIANGTAVPANDTHFHFGKAQKETELTLEPGKHTLTLQFANGLHISYGPEMSTTITIEVK